MYKIGDFSKKANVSIKTLRYYDKIDLFKPAYCDNFTGYRYYTDKQLIDITLIKELKKLNLSLDLIKEYLKTKNIKILRKKKEELEMQIENIINFVNNEYKNYKITKYDYNKYVLINGIKQSMSPQALEIRDGNANYYIIEKKKDFIDDFVIYTKEDNFITISRNKYLDNSYFDFVINYLKENKFKYITCYIPIEEEKILTAIREKFPNIEEEKVKQSKWEYLKFKIYL